MQLNHGGLQSFHLEQSVLMTNGRYELNLPVLDALQPCWQTEINKQQMENYWLIKTGFLYIQNVQNKGNKECLLGSFKTFSTSKNKNLNRFDKSMKWFNEKV